MKRPVKIDEVRYARLRNKAAARGTTPDAVANDAVNDFLDAEEAAAADDEEEHLESNEEDL